MIDLRKFPKLGVRVPVSLKRRVRQLALDMETDGFVFQGGEITMEAVFAVAALRLVAMSPEERAEAFGRHLPELLAMFEREMPGAADEKPAGEAAGPKDMRIEHQEVRLPAPRKRKRRGDL